MEAGCPGCGERWQVHEDLCGFRLLCDCGAWVAVPRRGPVGEAGLLEEDPEQGAAAPAAPRGDPAVSPARDPQPASLEEAPLALRTRWTNRTLVELAAILGAFWLPVLAVQLGAVGELKTLLMPLASLAGSVLVILVSLPAGPYAFGGLRRAPAAPFLEAVVIALLAAGAALLYRAMLQLLLPMPSGSPLTELEDLLGLPLVLFMVGFCPAVFEELAFRGLLQGRLEVLAGPREAILIGGAAFGLAHGITLALPIHVGLGLYLGWLRHRSASLLPGMVLHLAYNTTIVLAA